MEQIASDPWAFSLVLKNNHAAEIKAWNEKTPAHEEFRRIPPEVSEFGVCIGMFGDIWRYFVGVAMKNCVTTCLWLILLMGFGRHLQVSHRIIWFKKNLET